jgi:DNA-binding GntR family transcriptional regulator
MFCKDVAQPLNTCIQLKSMQSRTLAHEIAADVRRHIDRGTYEPGSPIRQEEIAARLGVSRIPVREALRLLEQEGVVVVHANRGAFVVEHDASTVAELFDIRLMLETDLVTRACGRVPPATFDRLEAINARLAKTRDRAEWIELDEEFHFAIYAVAERPRTFELARTLRRSLNAYYLRYLTPKSRDHAWDDEHQSMVSALRRGNTSRAATELERHLRGTQTLLVKAMKERSHK